MILDRNTLVRGAALGTAAAISPTTALQLLSYNERTESLPDVGSSLSFLKSGIDFNRFSDKNEKTASSGLSSANSLDSKNIAIANARRRMANGKFAKNGLGAGSLQPDEIDRNAGLKRIIAESIRANTRNTRAVIDSNVKLAGNRLIQERKIDWKREANQKKNAPKPKFGGAAHSGQSNQDKIGNVITKLMLAEGGQIGQSNFSIGNFVKQKSVVPGSKNLKLEDIYFAMLTSLNNIDHNTRPSGASSSGSSIVPGIRNPRYLNSRLSRANRQSDVYKENSKVGRFLSQIADGAELKKQNAGVEFRNKNTRSLFEKVFFLNKEQEKDAPLITKISSWFSKGTKLESKNLGKTYQAGEKSEIAITNVIPGLLSKLIATVGKGKTEYYDWATGTFKSAKAIEKEGKERSVKEVEELKRLEKKSKGLFGLGVGFLGADRQKYLDILNKRVGLESSINRGELTGDNQGLSGFVSKSFTKGKSAGSEIDRAATLFRAKQAFPDLTDSEINSVIDKIPSSSGRNKRFIEIAIAKYEKENSSDNALTKFVKKQAIKSKNYEDKDVYLSDRTSVAKKSYEFFKAQIEGATSLATLELLALDVQQQIGLLEGIFQGDIQNKFEQLDKMIHAKRAKLLAGESVVAKRDKPIRTAKVKKAQEQTASGAVNNASFFRKSGSSQVVFEDDYQATGTDGFRGFSSSANKPKRSLGFLSLDAKAKEAQREEIDKTTLKANKIMADLPKYLRNILEKPIVKGLHKVEDAERDFFGYTKLKDKANILFSMLGSIGSGIMSGVSALGSILGSVGTSLLGILGSIAGAMGIKSVLDKLPIGMGGRRTPINVITGAGNVKGANTGGFWSKAKTGFGLFGGAAAISPALEGVANYGGAKPANNMAVKGAKSGGFFSKAGAVGGIGAKMGGKMLTKLIPGVGIALAGYDMYDSFNKEENNGYSALQKTGLGLANIFGLEDIARGWMTKAEGESNFIMDNAKSAYEAVSGWVSKSYETVKGWFSTVKDVAAQWSDKASELFANASDWLSKSYDEAKNWLASTVEGATNWFSKKKDDFMGNGDKKEGEGSSSFMPGFLTKGYDSFNKPENKDYTWYQKIGLSAANAVGMEDKARDWMTAPTKSSDRMGFNAKDNPQSGAVIAQSAISLSGVEDNTELSVIVQNKILGALEEINKINKLVWADAMKEADRKELENMSGQNYSGNNGTNPVGNGNGNSPKPGNPSPNTNSKPGDPGGDKGKTSISDQSSKESKS